MSACQETILTHLHSSPEWAAWRLLDPPKMYSLGPVVGAGWATGDQRHALARGHCEQASRGRQVRISWAAEEEERTGEQRYRQGEHGDGDWCVPSCRAWVCSRQA